MTNCKYITKNGRCGLKGSYAYRHKCFTTDLCKCHKPMINADLIRVMSDEELAEFIQNMVDGSNSHNVACYGCINYGTHHSDPANKGTCLYECDGCENEGIGLDVLKWLQKPAEEGDHA